MTRLPVSVPVDGRHIAAVRSALGVTQQDLAAMVGVRSDDLSRLERHLLPGGLLDRVAAALVDLASRQSCNQPAPQS